MEAKDPETRRHGSKRSGKQEKAGDSGKTALA
jgi:hypothetical protein